MSKAFCACPTRFGAPPNTQTCPVCLGLPGALPVFNRRALELALRLAQALECRISGRSVFARKNYFYPDLPKGYQITQHESPLATGGGLVVRPGTGPPRTVRLIRLHVEEDAGKSVHDAFDRSTGIDHNRCGVPLVEVVTEPELRTPAEVHAFLVELRRLIRWLGVGDGNMEEGSLRCDCNVSLKEPGTEALGTRVELKNLSSFRAVVRAVEHEVGRQAALLASGGEIRQGTRLWDEAAAMTRPLREKEEAEDYRYLPDPDLPPLLVSDEALDDLRASLPELPQARCRRLIEELGLPAGEAEVLTQSRPIADFFEAVAAGSGEPREAAKWVVGELLAVLAREGVDPHGEALRLPVSPEQLAALIGLVQRGEVSESGAKRVFGVMAGGSREPAELVEELGLGQVSDAEALRPAVRDVIATNPAAVADHAAGRRRAFGFLVGRVLAATGGRANPHVVDRLLREELAR